MKGNRKDTPHVLLSAASAPERLGLFAFRKSAFLSSFRLCVLLVAFVSVSGLLQTASANETIYLQSGEQYEGAVKEITTDSVHASVQGRERVFPSKDVQRIEFQRQREFDSLDTTAALSAASPLFRDALAISTDELKKKYPQAGYVVLRNDLVIKVSKDFKCESERTIAWRILEQRGADSAFQSLYYFPSSQTAEVVYGITVAPDGKVARVSDSAFKTESVHVGLPEYDYLKRVRFSMKNPVPGATLFLKTRMTGTATALCPIVSDNVLYGYEPIVDANLTVITGPEATGSFSAVGARIEPQKDSLVWHVADAPQIMPEPLMPPLASFAPRVVVACPSSTWAKLAYDFISAVSPRPVAPAEGATARDVYDTVRRDIRTIGVPQDDLPVPPAPPDVVLKRKFGNKVEKALLLEAMLDGLRLEAHTVLVWGRSGGDLLPEAPRLKGYDHALVRLINPDSSETWLTADDRLAAFGEIPADAEGGEGLDLTTGMIIKVPTLGPNSQSSKRTVDIALSADDSGTVKDGFVVRGGAARQFRGTSDMTDEETYKWAQNVVCADVTGTQLVDWKHSDFEKANPEETLSFTYRVPDLAQVAGDFLILQLPNARYAPTDVGRPSHRYGLFWLGNEESEATFTIHAPEGYSVYATRDGVSKEGDGWRYAADFQKSEDGGALVFKETWSRTALDAPKEAYQPYREALITRGILRKEILVFQRKSK